MSWEQAHDRPLLIDTTASLKRPVPHLQVQRLALVGAAAEARRSLDVVLRGHAADRVRCHAAHDRRQPPRSRQLVTRKVALEETSEVIAAMDSYDTLGFTVIDRF